MATLEILGTGAGSTSDVETLQARPEFRKATRSMAMACSATQSALLPVAEKNAELGLVVGTCFGELGTTQEFLRAFAEKGMARPLLFQNSLYNSIAGFLAIHLGITGPAFTVSHQLRSGLDALELAYSLCEAGACKLCLVATVDARVPELDELFEAAAGDVMEGAAAALVGLPGAGALIGVAPAAHLEMPELTAASAHNISPNRRDAGAGLQRPLARCPLYQLVEQIQQGHGDSGRVAIVDAAVQGVALEWRRP